MSNRSDERQHHYAFGHRLLPEIAFRGPAGFARALVEEERARAGLTELWTKVGVEMPVPLPADGLHVEVGRCGDHEVPVICLPEPEVSPEAYFVALVVAKRGFWARLFGRPPRWRVMTLERGQEMDGAPMTFVGEWCQADGGRTHLNFGPGPEPTVEAFLRCVEPLVGW